jgi:hypothetical protein
LLEKSRRHGASALQITEQDMERKPNESFEQYKIRRAAANLATKNINRRARSGGATSTRKQLRSESNPKGTYGVNIIAKFARERVTPDRLAKHAAHVKHMADRKVKRVAAAVLALGAAHALAA